jgi:AcrR family transcriptional regulator
MDRPLRRDAERNRQRILDAAAELFAQRGLDVTLDEIAHRAGVGVGTAYRRFANKEELIEALFEQRMDELVTLAEQADELENGWEALQCFMERFLAVQAADRGLKEVLVGGGRGHDRLERARSRIAPVVQRIVDRAKAQGTLRDDVQAPDLALVQFMIGAVTEYAACVEPDVWQRLLVIVLDGLRARRDGPTPLPTRPLEDEELDEVMRAWRPRR